MLDRPSADLCALSATQAAQLIASGEVSSRALVAAVIERIAAVQPALNAFTTVCADTALAAAEEADRMVAEGGKPGPMHGVPFTVKDMIDVQGLPITWGSWMFKDRIAARDAVPVSRLRAAGAIPVAITTMPELGPKGLTDSPLYGVTRNPWDPSRTPGGSTGGGAAAAATGCAPVTLGTDAAGSVRLPASCCNLVGLKTTLGLIPDPGSVDLFGQTSGVGPIARSTADVALALAIMAGPHKGDPWSFGARTSDYIAAARPRGSLKGIRIAWAAKVGNEELDVAVAARCSDILEELAGLGADITEVTLDLSRSADVLAILSGSLMDALFADRIAEFGDRIDASLRESMKAATSITGKQRARAMKERSDIFRKIEAVLAEFDLIATPTLTAPPLRADHYLWDPIVVNGRSLRSARYDWFPYCHPFNQSGHPAVSVPAGLTADRLPVGFQLAAPWYGEDRLLRVAAELEAVRRWTDLWPPIPAGHAAA